MNVPSDLPAGLEPSPGSKHAAILNVALELISERGFHGTPMALLARRADVGVGTIYRYFENKEALIGELHDYVKANVNAAMVSGLEGEQPVQERFRHLWLNLAHYYLAHPHAFNFVEQYFYSPFITTATKAEAAERYAPVRAFFTQAQREGILKELPYGIVISVVTGTISRLVKRHLHGDMVLNEEMLELAAAACWDAIKL
jgi:AcrR family transcriptional regulator